MAVQGMNPQIFKLDSKGKLRVWQIELAGDSYRVHSGLMNGQRAVTGWKSCVAKSQPTDELQAAFEVDSRYKHQLDGEYHVSTDTVETPNFIDPMLCETYKKWPGPGWSQPKLDGMRCVAPKHALFRRSGKPITSVPHILEAMERIYEWHPTIVLDGELYNHLFKTDFNTLMSILRKEKQLDGPQTELSEKVIQFHVYDIVDTRMLFSERQKLLRELLRELDQPAIQYVETLPCETEEDAEFAYASHVEWGYEGGVYRLNGPYELGKRSKYSLKRKDFITEEFPVVSIEEGNGNWAGAAKRMTLRHIDGSNRTFGSGMRGTRDDNTALWEQTQGVVGPLAQATLRFTNYTPDGIPRFPVVIDYHPEGRRD